MVEKGALPCCERAGRSGRRPTSVPLALAVLLGRGGPCHKRHHERRHRHQYHHFSHSFSSLYRASCGSCARTMRFACERIIGADLYRYMCQASILCYATWPKFGSREMRASKKPGVAGLWYTVGRPRPRSLKTPPDLRDAQVEDQRLSRRSSRDGWWSAGRSCGMSS